MLKELNKKSEAPKPSMSTYNPWSAVCFAIASVTNSYPGTMLWV